MSGDYASRVAQEQQYFGDCETVHALPDIFHYWSNKYIRPKLEAAGFSGATEFFRDTLMQQCERNPDRRVRFLSVGSGNCELEVELASTFRSAGHSNFLIECMELSQTMLERGRAAAEAFAVVENLSFVSADVNEWVPSQEYDGVFAREALHHVVNLEGLFQGIHESLTQGGYFVVADTIGRNGHLRWPEARAIVHEYWRRLPPSYRYNHQLQRYEEMFEDWDCSSEGFEGIRAQDILPLLIEKFAFEKFIAFGNIIDPFVDRSFGPNFDMKSEWARNFIDEIHHRDEEEIRRGTIKPTHMWAVLRKEQIEPPTFEKSVSPDFCVRRVGNEPTEPPVPQDPYDWSSWPHGAQSELEIVCRRLTVSERQARTLQLEVEKRTTWALSLNKEWEERTAWALALDKELHDLRENLATPARLWSHIAKWLSRMRGL